ncbi:1-phosphofructokinase [Saccharibacillus alkalitolerans]|uniref:Tagatose-6-phosphate kinase n=1 Tax=Saccharibacillus alkalitolerans TaxID=2705290 RepID=A0ABX0F0J4_9BACL|nr:1-phosphofructokinase [Saccharibacillus alkalitolerans]NGZ74027.1 1-phosphofructokinase [Saccharibacillus alkalitolerans]
MIYTVTLNPSIDYIVEVEDLKLDALNRMKRDLKLPGGKGINVSRILSRLGIENTALGFLGGFTGRFIEDVLKAESIVTDFVQVQDDTRINIKLKHGGETEINGLGPRIGSGEAEALVEKLRALTEDDIVVLSGSVPPSLGGAFYDRLIAVIKEREARFVIDTTGEALLKALPHGPLLVKPNHHELAELFGVEIEGREDLIKYGRKLREMGAKNVLISMAGDGALLVTEEQVYHANVPKGEVKNSVGSGDSMIAGFVGTLSKTGDPLAALRTGTASGSATAFSDDLAERAKIDSLLEQVQVNPV